MGRTENLIVCGVDRRRTERAGKVHVYAERACEMGVQEAQKYVEKQVDVLWNKGVHATTLKLIKQNLGLPKHSMSHEEKKEMKVSLGTILGWCMRVLEDAALLAAFNTWNGSASDWSKVWGPFVAMCIGAQMQEKHVTLIAKIYEVEPAVPVEPAASKGVNEEAPLQMSSLSETLGIHMCAPHNYFAWLAVGFLT